MNNTKYKVVGMTCVACSTAIENKVRKLDGVKSASVNLIKEELEISYDIKKVNYEVLKKTLQKLGYDLTTEAVVKTNNFKIIMALILAFMVFYLAMTHMFKEFKLPIFDIVNHHTNSLNFALAEMVLTFIVIILGRDFYIKGIKGLIGKAPSMDTLIAIGTGSAFIYSLYATYQIYLDNLVYMDHLYYESAAVIIALVMLGKYLENISKKKTNDAISKLLNLVPDTANVLIDGEFITIKTSEVKLNDICLVKPGSKIPVDGVISEGETYVDESLITGESMPVKKGNGSQVIGGSINGSGAITIRATAIGTDTMISKIIKLVEDASSKKAPIAKMADTISSYFVPTIIVIAFLSATAWLLVGKDFIFAFTIFISVLVIACPCALGLATPVAIITATGKGAGKGILVKSGEALEIMHKAKIVVLDKTGTITVGHPTVSNIFSNIEDNKFIKYIASVEAKSEHPLAKAIVDYAKKENIDLVDVTNFEAISGLGVKAKIKDDNIIIGNYQFMLDNNIKLELVDTNKTVLYVGINNEYIGYVMVSDLVKDTSKEAILKLKKMGNQVYMLTGDSKNSALAIAKDVNIDNVIYEVLPKDKYKKIEKLKEEGKVIMVGDGINDAPALALADVGIAIGTGTDIAIESADVILIKGDLNDLVKAIKLSHFTIINIKQNLFWAFIYNIIGIPFAMGIFYIFDGPLLNPVIAGLAMAFSSLSVVLNALRLKGKKL